MKILVPLAAFDRSQGARGSGVGRGTMLRAGSFRVRFQLSYHSSRTMFLGSNQLLTETSTMNLPEGKDRSVHKADILSAICDPIF
jgi:hypothetical protein